MQVTIGSGDPLAQAVGSMIEFKVSSNNRALVGALNTARAQS